MPSSDNGTPFSFSNAFLRKCRVVLRHYYSDTPQVELIANDCGVELARIDRAGSVDVLWGKVLQEACKTPEVLRRILEEAASNYPGSNDLLQLLRLLDSTELARSTVGADLLPEAVTQAAFSSVVSVEQARIQGASNEASARWDFYIAHAPSDSRWADAIYETLCATYRVFTPSRCLNLGDNWTLQIPKEQRRSKVTLVLVTSSTDIAWYEREEICSAIQMASDPGQHHRVVPLYFEGISSPELIPFGLRQVQGFTLRGRADIPRLSKELGRILDGATRGGNHSQPRARHNPPHRNTQFIGRDPELQELIDLVGNVENVETPSAIVICGMGGVGKTQLAIEFAYRYLELYDVVMWVDASGGNIVSAVASLAQFPLDVWCDPSRTIDEVARSVKNVMADGRRYLLILDNVYSITVTHQLLPTSGHVHVLMTTRLKPFDSSPVVMLNPLAMQNAMQLLLGNQRVDATEFRAGEEMCRRLHCLPILISIASRILHIGVRAPSKLLADITSEGPLSLLDSGEEGRLQDYPFADRLFSASLDLIAAGAPVDQTARWVLWTASWLGPTKIPRRLLFEAIARHEFDFSYSWTVFEQALERLVALGLAQLQDGEPIFHPLVLHYCQKESIDGARRNILSVLSTEAMEITPTTLSLYRIADLRPHFEEAVIRFDEEFFTEYAWIPLRLIQYYEITGDYKGAISIGNTILSRKINASFASIIHFECGQASEALLNFTEALSHYQKALLIATRLKSESPISPSEILMARAGVFARMGRHDRALAEHVRGLLSDWIADQARELGHVMVLWRPVTLRRIGEILEYRGHFLESIEFLKAHLATETLPSSIERADTLRSIARVHERLGRYAEALVCLTEAGDVYSSRSGVSGYEFAATLKEMGDAQILAGSYEEARSTLLRAIDSAEHEFGQDHILFAIILESIAYAEMELCNLDRALELSSRAYVIKIRAMGANDASVAITIGLIAQILGRLGKYTEALRYCRTDISTANRLGSYSPLESMSLYGLGLLLLDYGEYDKAAQYFGQAVHADEISLGSQHPNVAIGLSALGRAFIGQGKYQDALDVCFRAEQIQKRHLGEKHPDVAITSRTIGHCLAKQGRFQVAQQRYHQAHSVLSECLRDHHLEVAVCLHLLGEMYLSTGETEQSVDMQTRALNIVRRNLGLRHPYVWTVQFDLGRAIERRSPGNEGTELMREAYERLRLLLRDDSPVLLSATRIMQEDCIHS